MKTGRIDFFSRRLKSCRKQKSFSAYWLPNDRLYGIEHGFCKEFLKYFAE